MSLERAHAMWINKFSSASTDTSFANVSPDTSVNDLSVGEVRMKAFRQINFLSSDFTLQVSNARSSYKTYLTICLWGGGGGGRFILMLPSIYWLKQLKSNTDIKLQRWLKSLLTIKSFSKSLSYQMHLNVVFLFSWGGGAYILLMHFIR